MKDTMHSNQINPRKLIHSKWTATKPLGKAKHFIVTEVEFDQDGLVTNCLVEAVLSKRSISVQWRELKNREHWLQGWK
jgi:tryptophan-rich hypothetical protein